MPTVHLVHGFNVRNNGATTTDKLRPHYEDRGFRVVEHDYGWRGLLGVRFGNRKRAEKLAAGIEPGDILVGHSDGCNVITMALWLLASLGSDFGVRCVFYNPALDRDTAQSPVVRSVLVFHTKSDRVVWLSRILMFHPWGEAGRLGFHATAKGAYVNQAYEELGLRRLGHSGAFQSQSRIKATMKVFDEWQAKLSS